MADEEIDDRVNLDKILEGRTGRITSVVSFGMADLHVKDKIEFSDTDTSNSITLSPYTELPDPEGDREEVINFLNPNPDSFYTILAHNTSSQAATLRVFNEWDDVDENSRQTELTNNGHIVSAESSEVIPVEGLFCGNNSVIQGEVDNQEGCAWNLYVNIYRP